MTERSALAAARALTEVREHAVREPSMYEVSADQYAATNNESRMDEESSGRCVPRHRQHDRSDHRERALVQLH